MHISFKFPYKPSTNARGHDLHYPAILLSKAHKWKSKRATVDIAIQVSDCARPTCPGSLWLACSSSTTRLVQLYILQECMTRVLAFFSLFPKIYKQHFFVCAVPHHCQLDFFIDGASDVKCFLFDTFTGAN